MTNRTPSHPALKEAASASATIAVENVVESEPTWPLMKQILVLAVPVMMEHFLHLAVGITDTYMANHLKTDAANGAAAVGTIAYFLWFIGLVVAAIGTGATAIIARAIGARHKSLANSVCGQSITASLLLGLGLAAFLFIFAKPLITVSGLTGRAPDYALSYLRMLTVSIPFTTVMLTANSCLRGAGDTRTPAISMIIMDVVNIFFTYSLTRGAFGLPEMGFDGIAVGTVIAYIAGGVIQFGVLIAGRGGIRLHLHRMRPHWLTLKRVLRVGIPSGVESMLSFIAQFVVIHVINGMDASNRVPTAHNNAVRLESLSYMLGFGVATAAATMVGQSLGAKNTRRAARSAWLCYALGGGIMITWGLFFILGGGKILADWMSPDPEISRMTAQCLFITGFIQSGFAAALVFSGALRGAGDTFAVMLLNLISVIAIRFAGVLVLVKIFHASLAAVWVVLSAELFFRGILMTGRFMQGKWQHARV